MTLVGINHDKIGSLVVKMVNTAGAIEGQRRGSPSGGDENTIRMLEASRWQHFCTTESSGGNNSKDFFLRRSLHRRANVVILW